MVTARESAIGRGIDGISIRLVLMVALALCVLLIYAPTFRTMIMVWSQSQTFVHGFLVFPLSAYIIWKERGRLAGIVLRPSWSGLVALVVSVAAWIVSHVGSLQIGEHFALVAMLSSTLWFLLGDSFVQAFRFPLLYAFFAVPFGEFLVPSLMLWTAHFVVAALTLTGVPVYLEGFFFSLPNGDFEVVEACSGIRYLIVTVVLGVFFAYEQFTTFRRGALFVLAAAAVIIMANGIRAYLVVYLAHLWDMRYFTGVDHLWFGSAVFALFILVTFWFGMRYADKDPAALAVSDRAPIGIRWRMLLPATGGALTLLAVGPLLAANAQPADNLSFPSTALPAAAPGWSASATATQDFAPLFDADARLAGGYRAADSRVDLHVIFNGTQAKGGELVRHGNAVFDAERWRQFDLPRRTYHASGDSRWRVNELSLADYTGQRLLLWHWYDVGGQVTASDTIAILLHTIQKVAGHRDGEAAVILVTDVADVGPTAVSAARGRLSDFLEHHAQAIETCLRWRDQRPRACAAR